MSGAGGVSPHRAALDHVDPDLIMRHLTHIAQYVKLSGGEQEAESLAYIQHVLDGFGYATMLLEYDAYISLPGPGRLD